MCPDCEVYGLKRDRLTRSDCLDTCLISHDVSMWHLPHYCLPVSLDVFPYRSWRTLVANESGVLTSINCPYSYPPALDYHVTLQAPLGSVIRLTLEMLDLQNSSSCTKDVLEVLDRYQPNSNAKHQFCGQHSAVTDTIVSYLHSVDVRFVSDRWSNTTGQGFVMSFTTEPGKVIYILHYWS